MHIFIAQKCIYLVGLPTKVVFSSISFLVYFLPLFFLVYVLSPKPYRNVVLLLGSILFYSWGAPKFIFVILITTFVDFYLVKLLQQHNGAKRRLLLIASVSVNLALLFYFKYCNFFIENVNHLSALFGGSSLHLLKVILPIGISFYTFESITYSVDVYRRAHAPLKNFWDYQLYIIFFPKLIAGPIVRYHEIADQVNNRVESSSLQMAGLLRFSMGLAKKVLIANTMAFYADEAFSTPVSDMNASVAWTGMLCYSFQIYFDFSGYSDMALGLAKMFGFILPENFNQPYSASSITDFWRRWHMSLGRWMRNYLYIPLGGNQNASAFGTYINLFIVFFASGLWHGASWTFVVWGMYHGFFLVLERAFLLKALEKLPRFITALYSFLVVAIGWVFFRADSVQQASQLIGHLFTFDWGALTIQLDLHAYVYIGIAAVISFVPIFIGERWSSNHLTTANVKKEGTFVWRYAVTAILITYSLAALSSSEFNPFIYFRF